MIIQFSDLLSKRSRKKEISLSFPFEKIIFEGDEITAVDPVCVEGMITTYEDMLVMKATIKTKLNLTCSRCLDTFIYPIDIEIEERFTNNEELRNEEDVIFVEGDSINITEIIENSIISTLPIKRLCKSDCKGLCSSCGANKNTSSCNCNNEDVDIRLAKLRELFGE